MVSEKNFNIVVTLNEAYLPHLRTMLASALYANPEAYLKVFLLHSSVREESVYEVRELLGARGELFLINAGERELEGAPTTERFPVEMYYRIFAAKYLPDGVDRALYLDPDIIINGSLDELYGAPLENCYFAAASHVGKGLNAFNGVRLKSKGTPYINSGVLLINVALLRREQSLDAVFDFIRKNKSRLWLPDQDVISALYGSRILLLDTYKYNLTEKIFKSAELELSWVRENCAVIHYCGKNKPWNEKYSGELDIFYRETLERLDKPENKEIGDVIFGKTEKVPK